MLFQVLFCNNIYNEHLLNLFMLNLLDNSIIISQNQDFDYTLIWLHGLGADANDFVPVAKMLPDTVQKNIRFIFPNAPMQPITINQGYVMQAWYDIKDMQLLADIDNEGILKSVSAILSMINTILETDPSQKILIAGFSQGGVIALAAALTHESIVGALALSTYLPLLPDTLVAHCPPIFIGHGTGDTIVPFTCAAQTAHCLNEKFTHTSIEMKSYPMEHSVSEEEIIDIGQWLSRIISTAQSN